MRTQKQIKIKKFKLPRKLKKEVRKVERVIQPQYPNLDDKGNGKIRIGYIFLKNTNPNKWTNKLILKWMNEDRKLFNRIIDDEKNRINKMNYEQYN